MGCPLDGRKKGAPKWPQTEGYLPSAPRVSQELSSTGTREGFLHYRKSAYRSAHQETMSRRHVSIDSENHSRYRFGRKPYDLRRFAMVLVDFAPVRTGTSLKTTSSDSPCLCTLRSLRTIARRLYGSFSIMASTYKSNQLFPLLFILMTYPRVPRPRESARNNELPKATGHVASHLY